MRLMVVKLGMEEAKVRIRYRFFEVLKEKGNEVILKPSKNQLLDGKDTFSKQELGKIKCKNNSFDAIEAKVFVLVKGDESDWPVLREWMKKVKEHTLAELKSRNTIMKSLYEKVKQA